MKKTILITGLLLSCFCILGCGENLTAEEAFNKGKEYFKENDSKKAYKYFKKALDKSKENPHYHWAAAKTAPNRNMAFIHTKGAWDNGLKSFEVLLSLTNLSFHTEKTEKLTFALSLFEELPAKIKNEELRGNLFQQFGEYDSCLAIWENLYRKAPTPELCNKIAIAYGKKGERDNALSFILNCKKGKQLNSEGYIILAYLMAFDFDYKGINTLFNEAEKYGYYNNKVQLEHAGFLIIEGKLAEAEKLLFELSEPAAGKKESSLNQRARIMLSYIYRAEKNSEKITYLMKIVQKNRGEDDAELHYYRALTSLLFDSSNALSQLKSARNKLPRYPVIELIYARENAGAGNFVEAATAYKNLPDVFIQSPRILIENANALARTGKYNEALAAINILHRRKLFTKHSLELFRDITFKKQLIEKSMAAQKILERQYKDDAGVQYTSAILSLKNGKPDEAQKILTDLAIKYPEEERFEIARIAVYLVKEKYEQAIDECNKSKIDPYLLSPLKTRAYIKLGKPEMAEKIYQKNLKRKKSIRTMLEYAQFLLNSGNYKKAVTLYKDIMRTYKQKLEKDSTGNALLLNNFAWALLQAEPSDKKVALSAAKKAYALSSNNISILDTYATALIENKKFKGCIKLLGENTLVDKESQLMYHLATAYDRTGDTNKAVRTYQDALKIAESSGKLTLAVDKSSIQRRIDELISEK